MPDERRSRRPGSRPGAGRSPARTSGPRRSRDAQGARDARSARPSTAAAPVRASGAAAAGSQPKFTGRAAVLVLVLAVLAVSYASSLRAYLEQRADIEALQSEIERSQAGIDELEREKARWSDPAYVASQARARFGYVEPGETPFVVVDENGDPIDGDSPLSDPDSIGDDPAPRAWYDDVWQSVQVAGDPPTEAPAPPLTEIDGSDEPTGE